MAVPMEYLDAGRSPLPGRWVAFGVALVVVLAGLLAGASAVLADRAQAAVSSGVVAADEQERAGVASVRGTLAYAEPLIWSASAPPQVRESLQELVRRDAARVAAGLAALADGVRGAWLLPWQGTERAERDAAAVRIEGQAAPFRDVARDVRNMPGLRSGARQ